MQFLIEEALETDVPKASYTWEQGIQASWDTVVEDASGRIVQQSVQHDRDRATRAKQQRITQSIRRGLIRFLILIIDCSISATEKDYRPTRLEVCKQSVQKFIRDFFDQNPISQLSLAVTRDRIAEKLSELSGNSKNHIHKVQGLLTARGLASLQNSLLLAIAGVKHVPNYGHREALIIYNSLSTCDPGNIYETIEEAKKSKLKVHVICLAAEIFICKQVAELTGGQFAVAMDSQHLLEILQNLTIPPPDLTSAEELRTDFVYMGFPKRAFENKPLFSFDGKKTVLSSQAYICPRCATRATDIPTECMVCKLQLNSSSHIARSHHHLFPVTQFEEFTVKAVKDGHGSSTWENFYLQASSQQQHYKDAESVPDEEEHGKIVPMTAELSRCRGCLDIILQEQRLLLRCPQCANFFCVDCDLFIHDSLHACPGC